MSTLRVLFLRTLPTEVTIILGLTQPTDLACATASIARSHLRPQGDTALQLTRPCDLLAALGQLFYTVFKYIGTAALGNTFVFVRPSGS